MPQLLGDIWVVTKEELVPTCFPTYDALRMKLKRYESKAYGIKRAMCGGNGRKLLVIFSTLDKEKRDKIGDPSIADHALEKIYKTTTDIASFFSDFKYKDGSYLKDVEQKIIDASTLVALVKLEGRIENERISLRHSTRGIKKQLWRESTSFNELLIQEGAKNYQEGRAHNLNSSYPRFIKQYSQFKDLYLAGDVETAFKTLIKDIEGKSKRNAIKLDDATGELLTLLFAGTKRKPSATEVARQYDGFLDGYVEVINSVTGEAYQPKEYKQLSHRTIKYWLSKWENKIGTELKRSGDRQKYMQKFIPYESLEQPSMAGSIISIDDRQPPFEYEKGKRMWWYMGIDLASEAFTCWSYGKSKEGIITNFYQNLIKQYHSYNVNIPNQLECESSLNSSFTTTFLREGAMFQDVDIHPNSARSKRIERWFGDLRQKEKSRAGWLSRPFARSEANQAGPGKKQIIPYDELVEQCLMEIVIWNNSEHTKIKGKTRWEVFLERQNPDLKPTNYKAILPHLGKLTPTSCNAGIIKLQSKEWVLGDNNEIYTGEKLITLLKQVEGKDINIYWLDDLEGDVMKALIYKEDRLICEALAKPVSARASIEATAENYKAREIMSRYRNTVTQFSQMQKNNIDKVVVIDNRPKMLNNKFQIPGIKNFEPRKTPVVVHTEEIKEVEEIYNPNKKTITRGLKDAFKL